MIQLLTYFIILIIMQISNCFGNIFFILQIFTEQQMPLVSIIANLTIHKIGFYLKFPATLFLQLEIDRTYQTITSELTLSKQPININKQIGFETAINFNIQTNTYETKKINIVIYIKTKTSPNKLSAGVITLQISRPSQNIKNAIAKPNRCNDPKAFIQYSLRTESNLKIPSNPQSRSQSQQKNHPILSSTQPNIFKSAVHYINHHNEQQQVAPTNQLDKYLNDSLSQSRKKDRRRFKSSGKLPQLNRLNQQIDDSRTQRMGIRRDKIANDCSIISSQESIAEKKVKQLSKKSEILSRQIKETKHNYETLLNQNKDLKSKIKQFQFEIQEQSTTIAILTKKLQLKQNSLGQQLKLIRTKLQDSDIHARQLLLEKNELLNQKQNKQKQCVLMIKQREKQANEEKRKFINQLQEKRYQIQNFIKEKREFWDEITHARGLADDLIKQNTELKQRIRQGTDNIELLSKELSLKTQELKVLTQQQKNKGKNNQQSKNQRKIIFQLKKQKQQKVMTIKQQKLIIQQLQQKLGKKDEEIKAKLEVILSLQADRETLKKKIQQQYLKTIQLHKKLNEYQRQLQKGSDKASKIGKQIKSFESQITSMKKIAYDAKDEKQKISIDYQRLIEQLQLKIENLTQKRSEQQEKYEYVQNLLKKKQDENYDLGQMAVSFRQQISTIRNQLDILRQENAYLLKSLKDLSQKQQKIMRLEERVDFTQKLYEETEHKLEIQRIQYENQLRLFQEKYEQKCQKTTRMEQELIKVQKDYRGIQDQLEDTRNRLNHKINELNYIKAENEKQRENNIQYQQKMVAYRRIQQNSETTMDDLKEENYALRRTLKQSEEALNNVGKRFDSFCQSTSQCLSELLQLVRSQRKIINKSVRHIKPEISSILNDCIRYLGLQREQAALQLANTKKLLQEQVGKNRQNIKIIKVKTNIQAELQQEISKFKAYQEILLSKIAILSGEKQENIRRIKQQEAIISELKQGKINLEREFSVEIRKKESEVALMQDLVRKNENQFNLQRQRHTKNIEIVKIQMNNMQKALKDRITSIQQQLSQTNNSLKSSQEQNRQISIKINDLENTIAKINKQKQDVYFDLEKRTKDLMASRSECEDRNKKIFEKQNELTKVEREKTELIKQKQDIQNRKNVLQQKYQQILTKKQEAENSLRQKTSQIAAFIIRIDELEDWKKKISAQKQQLIKSKNNQQTVISNLNKTAKQLKDQIVKSQQTANNLILQKQSQQKQYIKKIKNIEGQKNILQKQCSDLKQRISLKQNEFNSKQKALSQQLKTSKIKLGQYSTTVQNLRREIDKSNIKINQLSGQISTITNDFQSREKKIFPSGSKLKQIMKAVGQLRSIGKQYQTSKNQLLKMTNINENHDLSIDTISDIVREISTGINRLKVQILSKNNLAKEVKIGLIEGLKNIQITAEKFNRGY